jgi:hypothetical protein
MSGQQPLQPKDVPESCPDCGSKIVWGKFWYRGFENEALHVGALCSNATCHDDSTKRRWVPFPHGQWIKMDDLLHLQLENKDLGLREVVDVGPSKLPDPCEYEGCEITNTQRHHIMPRAYMDDADKWPKVTLCVYHHDKWHAFLTTGLVKKAISFRGKEFFRQWKLEREDEANDQDEVDHQWTLELDYWLPWEDLGDAEVALKFAEMNLQQAKKWHQRAANECRMVVGEDPVFE